ncbi:MAG: F0F1 ATP synthase subunit gamma [Alphaproteobacteria bacterium]|nr:F0F1 ATP synthase subunit gamma [Alphaproteobacteria bacterium]
MPSLKDLKNRIASVKSTRKITSAMKMVAASKLRRAQEQAEATRPYAERMARMLASLSANLVLTDTSPKLIAGTGKEDVCLLLVVTSDRGLCGGFNGTVVREARRQIKQLRAEGKQVKIFCVGRKGRDLLRREFAESIVHSVQDIGRKRVGFGDAHGVTEKLLELYEGGQFDTCRLVYNRFKSAISQITTVQQLIPAAPPAANENQPQEAVAPYEFEPGEEEILAQILPKNLALQVFGALLESAAGEQGARMTAMDNATRNAGDMINRLTLNYNRSRQAYITKELIEIISGAEAI